MKTNTNIDTSLLEISNSYLGLVPEITINSVAFEKSA